MLGIGIQPAGLSSAGLGAIEATPELPIVTSGARFFDSDGDRLIDPSTGSFARQSANVQRVQLALATELGSSTADFNFGCVSVAKMDDTFEARAKNSALSALRFLIDAGEIEIISVTIEKLTSQRVNRLVKFKDLKTGAVETVQNRVL
jgi:hypothetical protein